MKKTWTLCEKIMNVYKGECALYHHQSGKHTAACTKKWREYPLHFSVSKKWQMPLFRGSKFGQPEVARICKELILQAKSTTREAGLHEEKSEGLRPLRHLLKAF